MRLAIVIAAVVLIGFFVQTGSSQDKDKGKDKEKPQDTKILQIAGKTLDQWIKEIGSTDPSKRENAIRTVVMFGPDRAYEAVPALLDQLRKHTPAAPIDASIRVNVPLALGFILGGTRDPDLKLVKEAVVLLKRLMSDSQSIVRYRTAQALGRIGTEAKDAVPELISATRDPQTWETRQAAAFALGFVAREEGKAPGQNVINALYALLGSGVNQPQPDKACQVRLAAVQSITFLGGPADKAYKAGMVKSLEPVALKDPDGTVRIWAHMAIMSISLDISDYRVDAVAKFLTHNDVAVRVQAAQALGTIGPKAKRSIPALIDALPDPEPAVVGWVIYALGRMEIWADTAVPHLVKIRDDSKQVEVLRKAAEEAVEFINGKQKEIKEKKEKK